MEQRKVSLVDRLRPLLNWEVGLYALLLLIALVMRLWDLDARSVTHDESLHAIYSWYLFDGRGWHHDPMMHGPFQFYGNALIFFLFGDTDFTVRLLPALFGTALVALPYFLRHQFGRLGAFTVAFLLAFSPLILYYGRYARNEIYIVVWTFIIVICMWRYFAERKARYLYISAAALSLSFCTKEVSYINAGILGLFLIIMTASELVHIARNRFNLKELSPVAEFLLFFGTLSLPLFSPFIQLIPGLELPSGFHWAKLLTFVILFVICAAIGLLWNWRRWLISALIFYGILTTLYTSLFGLATPSDVSALEGIKTGLGSGVWGSVDYWIEQHGVARGGQPLYYYLVILPIYEFLPLTFAFIGALYYAIRGNSFSRFLIYWALISLGLYSFAGERMPWLSLHIAFPVILLGGMFIGRLFQDFDWQMWKIRAVRGATVLVLLLLVPFSIHVAVQESYRQTDDPPQMLLYAAMSFDIKHIVSQINELAEERGEHEEMRISVDSPLNWAVYWYLRDYKHVGYSDLSAMSSPPEGTVLLLASDNEATAQPYLDNYDEGQRFHYLTWFPEEYRDFKPGWWWRYFLHRETNGPYWQWEAIAYFPQASE
ncbi:MAG: TIGR03663 family protein [Chloroflexota bacterium]|nr:TIGR03663 family protein [Chloroflexota bacterium]